MLKSTARKYRNLLLYGTIGVTALLLELIIFYILTTAMGVNIPLSNAGAMGLGFFVSFGLNAFVNFKVRDRLFARLVRFGIITVGGYFVSTGIILGLTEILFVAPMVAKLISLPFFFLFQYTLNSKFTFHTFNDREVTLPSITPESR